MSAEVGIAKLRLAGRVYKIDLHFLSEVRPDFLILKEVRGNGRRMEKKANIPTGHPIVASEPAFSYTMFGALCFTARLTGE